MMTLAPADSTGEQAEAHEKSDQVLLMLEGELTGEVGDERPKLKKGDVIIHSSRCEASLQESRRKAGDYIQCLFAARLSERNKRLSGEQPRDVRRDKRVTFRVQKFRDWRTIRRDGGGARESGFA